jgi:hypothetical protein
MYQLYRIFFLSYPVAYRRVAGNAQCIYMEQCITWTETDDVKKSTTWHLSTAEPILINPLL